MKPKAIIGLVRSRMAYIRDWPEFLTVSREDGEATSERVFDLSEILTEANAEMEVPVDLTTLGRHLPFPMLAIVGSGDGVFIVCGDETGFYVYCYTSPVPVLLVRFTSTGWRCEGARRNEEGIPERISGDDIRVKRMIEAVGMLLTLVERACEDTRHVVSYTLNRAERRNAIRETGFGSLDTTVVHHVSLNARARQAIIERRGATVVPTPKRLHEVRAHWRHLKSGAVVRVRSHRRGQRGDVLLPRVYTPRDKP